MASVSSVSSVVGLVVALLGCASVVEGLIFSVSLCLLFCSALKKVFAVGVDFALTNLSRLAVDCQIAIC